MAGRIPTSFIHELLSRVDLVELVGARVKLKKAGHEFGGLCPFHQEKTPSFTVSPIKQFYHCFGCGAHGNAIDFLMQQDRLGFIEAVEWLANQVNMVLPERVGAEDPAQRQQRQNWGVLLNKLVGGYQQQLAKSKQAQQYFAERGLSQATIERFQLGYAPPGWRYIHDQHVKNPQMIQELVALGMVIKKADGAYDRFRDRVIFPIHNMRGEVIGFGGRSLGDEQPKYLNSPETPLFQKGRELYGLNHIIRRNKKPQSILVVEGYMDVIGLAEHGVTNAVATLGTAVTSSHLSKLTRVCAKLAFCFDGDAAGKRAAWRAMQAALPLLERELSLHFVFLPQGHDPDSYIKAYGKDKFAECLRQSASLVDFFFTHLGEGLPLAEFAGKAALAQRALPLIDTIPQGVYRPMMLQALSQRVNLPVDELGKLVKSTPDKPPPPPSPAVESVLPLPKSNLTPVQTVIGLLLQHPELAELVQLVPVMAQSPLREYACLHQLLSQLQNQAVPVAALLEGWRDTELEAWLRHLASWQFLVVAEAREQEFKSAYTRCIQFCLQQQIEQMMEKMRSGELSPAQRDALQAAIQQQKRLQLASSSEV